MNTPAKTLPTFQPLDAFEYHRDSDGCDDLWVIYCPKQDRDIARITFWDCSPEWMARSEGDARLLSSAPPLFNAVKQLLSALETLPSRALTVEMLDAEQTALQAISRIEGGHHA